MSCLRFCKSGFRWPAGPAKSHHPRTSGLLRRPPARLHQMAEPRPRTKLYQRVQATTTWVSSRRQDHRYVPNTVQFPTLPQTVLIWYYADTHPKSQAPVPRTLPGRPPRHHRPDDFVPDDTSHSGSVSSSRLISVFGTSLTSHR